MEEEDEEEEEDNNEEDMYVTSDIEDYEPEEQLDVTLTLSDQEENKPNESLLSTGSSDSTSEFERSLSSALLTPDKDSKCKDMINVSPPAELAETSDKKIVPCGTSPLPLSPALKTVDEAQIDISSCSNLLHVTTTSASNSSSSSFCTSLATSLTPAVYSSDKTNSQLVSSDHIVCNPTSIECKYSIIHV